MKKSSAKTLQDFEIETKFWKLSLGISIYEGFRFNEMLLKFIQLLVGSKT